MARKGAKADRPSAGAVLLVLTAALALGVWGILRERRLPSPHPPAPSPPPVTATATSPEASPEAEPSHPEAAAAIEAAVAGPTQGAPPAAPRPGPPSRRGGRRGAKPAPAAPIPSPGGGAPPGPGGVARAFVTGPTRVGSLKTLDAELKGFDPEGVEVRRAPETAARIEFDVLPPKVRTGDAYTVRIYLHNDGKKAIRIKALKIASQLNGRRSRSDVSSRTKEVLPALSALVAEVPGIWKDGTASWTVEAEVVAERGETYKNALTWK